MRLFLSFSLVKEENEKMKEKHSDKKEKPQKFMSQNPYFRSSDSQTSHSFIPALIYGLKV